MKKILSYALTATLLLSLAGCADTDNTVSGGSSATSQTVSKYVHNVDVMSYVKDGIIPELPVALGDYMDEVKSAYNYVDPTASSETASSTEDDAMAFVQHEEEFSMILDEQYLQVSANTGEAFYIYKTRYEGYGISKIACMKNCYGFIVGATLKQDIIDGVNAEANVIDTVDAESIDFLPGATMSNFTAVSFTESDYTVTFYFTEDDFLSFTTICDNRYWYDGDEE